MHPAVLRQPIYDPRLSASGISPAPDHARYDGTVVGNHALAFPEDAFCASTTDGRISVWTPAAERLSGYISSEVVGRNFSILVPPDLTVAVEAIRDRVIQGETLSLPYALFPKKDGSRVQVAARLAPLRDAFGEISGVGVVFRDISDEFCDWEARAKALRMGALELLAGGVARELEEIVSALASGCRGVRSAPEDGLAQIDGAAARLRTLKRELSAFAGMQQLDGRRTCVDHMLASMSRVLEAAVGPDVKLEQLRGAAGATVFADPLQLGQAILHLVGSARDRMGGRGNVIVETTVEDDQWPAGAKPRVCVVIRVTEVGTGLDARARRRVFEPFVPVAPGAAGLALAAAYGIVRQSGGHIIVESRLEWGTTYAVYLAANRGPHERTPPRGSHIFASDALASESKVFGNAQGRLQMSDSSG